MNDNCVLWKTKRLKLSKPILSFNLGEGSLDKLKVRFRRIAKTLCLKSVWPQWNKGGYRTLDGYEKVVARMYESADGKEIMVRIFKNKQETN